MCDWMSRNAFDDLTGLETEGLAKEAFARMDRQLDLMLQAEDIILSLMSNPEFPNIQQKLRVAIPTSEFESVWRDLEEARTKFIDGKMFFRTEKDLFCERKMVVTDELVSDFLLWSLRTALSSRISGHCHLNVKLLIGQSFYPMQLAFTIPRSRLKRGFHQASFS